MTGATRFGQDVDEHDPQVARPERARGLDVLPLASDSVWPRTTLPTAAQEKNAMTRIEIRRLGPDDRHERDREEQERERQDDVHEAGEDVSTTPPK